MADAGSKTRLRRTRTGCFKCRMRRRKCDEGKPSCRRCVDGGFDCQYGTRLSFLEKNAKTSGDSSSERVSKPAYGKLRFVVPESVTVQETIRFQEDEAPSQDSESTHALPKAGQPLPETPNPVEFLSQPPALISPAALENLATPSPVGQGNHDLIDPGSYTVGISPSNAAYETALDGLLSLGHDNFAPTSAPPPASAPVTSQILENESYFGSSPNPRPDPSPGQLDAANKPSAGAFQNCAHLPQDRAVQLLRHYRYNIAPWLDIGDASQTFGLLIPRIAMDSIPVLDSILALALTTLGEQVDLNFDDSCFVPPDLNGPSVDILHGALVSAFMALRRHVVVAPTSWQSPSKNVGLGLLDSALFQEHYPTVNLALSWMTLRLELSVGLMNGSSVSIPSVLSCNDSSPMSGMCRETLKYDREPILLCARVLNHCFGHDLPTNPGMHLRPSAAQSWKSLSEALNMWYNNRPRDFKPMWEVEESEELFPLILFTNGAAVLANQLYHTSMLLLLQSRPRTLPKEHGRSVLISPLWHAQRICAISLNNDNQASWDLSLLASLFFAAKRMTYEPQQHAILRGLDRIGSLTGWNVNALSAQLVQEWQPD
ncbi:hypothetical protein EDB81DRAFT_403247 [Dactylonectria macrodidyma]|uniref:Zn(2)-C6 fungal-type domain-containing protein n=1 Tax=Dactylonectria macrodidyma TaxID=307937 RepID=A0A9P9JE68_9HYPO|nr:hypothetical protein EDB81DRAFT_403247 [Dactylonectria macrodidyma]